MDRTNEIAGRPWEETKRNLNLRWTTLSNSSAGVQPQHCNPVIAGHLVYFFGVYGGPNFGRVFNLNQCTWADVAAGHKWRYNHVCALAEDKVYIYGGQQTQVEYVPWLIEYDLVLNTSQRVRLGINRPGLRTELPAVYVPWRKEVVYFGGNRQTGNGFQTIHEQNDTFALSVDRLSWHFIEMKGSLPRSRRRHSARLVGRNMYIYGGVSGTTDILGDICVADMR